MTVGCADCDDHEEHVRNLNAEIERLRACERELAAVDAVTGRKSHFAFSSAYYVERLRAALDQAIDFIDPNTDPWLHVTHAQMAQRLRAANQQNVGDSK